jgi:hypothetical protein
VSDEPWRSLAADKEREAAAWSEPEGTLPCPRCGEPVVLPGYWRAAFAPLCGECWKEPA